MKKVFLVEWEIHDTRNMNGGYRTGVSEVLIEVNRTHDGVNQVIEFCRNLPSWELKRNNIDIEEYRDDYYSKYYYMTMISKIIKVVVAK